MNISTKTPLKDVLKFAEDCNKCGHCCKYSSGYLVEGDSKKIAKFLNISEKILKQDFLEEGEKFNTKLMRPKIIKKDKPYGECVFFDDKRGCTIHPVKPLHCRVGGCNEHGEDLHLWFTINYFVNQNDPESIRQWAAYLKNHPTITGGQLQDLVPNEKKLKQILNFEILR